MASTQRDYLEGKSKNRLADFLNRPSSPLTAGYRISSWQSEVTDLLSKLVNLWPRSRLNELMPLAWAAAHSNSKLAA